MTTLGIRRSIILAVKLTAGLFVGGIGVVFWTLGGVLANVQHKKRRCMRKEES